MHIGPTKTSGVGGVNDGGGKSESGPVTGAGNSLEQPITNGTGETNGTSGTEGSGNDGDTKPQPVTQALSDYTSQN